jgi:glycosyltransferase involved in cell wall biosynthesis
VAVRLVLWHGYLLEGTGSNIYTQHVARAWGRLGHDVVVVCQEPRPEQFDLGPNVRVVRPDVGPLLPVFVLDRYEGIESRHVADMTAGELELFVDRNARAVATAHDGRADLVLANHVLMGGPVAARACAGGAAHSVKIHGSELEYAIRGRPQLAALAVDSLAGAGALFAGSGHIVEVTEELLGRGLHSRMHVVPPGVDTDAFHPGGGDLAGLIAMLRRDAAAPHPGRPAERAPDADAADRLAGLGRFVLYFGKLMRQKGVHLLLEAWSRLAAAFPDVALVIVGFGDARAELEAMPAERVIFTGAMDHHHLHRLVPLADAVVVPSVLPEAFGMVAAEAASCGVVPIVANHSGLADVAAGLGANGVTFDGTARDLEARLGRVLALPETRRHAMGLGARAAVIERWSWEGIARRLIDLSLA